MRQKVALVGTGNFALNIAALFSHFGVKLEFFVDEYRTEDFQGVPVFRATELTRGQIDAAGKFVIAISYAEHCAAAVRRLQDQGVPEQCILVVADDPSIQILRLLFEKFGDAAVDAFCREGCTSIPGLERDFLEASWQHVLTGLDPKRRTLGFCYYGRGGGFRRHLSPLIPYLKDRFNLVSVSDELMEGDGEIQGRHLFMGTESACRRSLFDLVFSAHVFPCSPPSVPRVTFSHVIYDFNLSLDYHAERIARSDTHYVFASSGPSLQGYVRLIKEKRLRNRLCVIPGGYMHLDENIELAAVYRGPVDSIIYAPTLSLADYPHCDLATSMNEGSLIVERLLAGFPDFNIIFRPHPSDLKLFQLNRRDARNGQFSRLLELCREHPRCLLDDNPTSYMKSYNRAALMVSDTSSTAMTFAFTTGRPVFFYAPRNNDLMATLGKQMSFVHDRCKVGEIATSLEDLMRQVEWYLLNEEGQRTEIKEFRDKVIFNVGNAGAYLARNVDYILHGEKHAEWLYFNW